MACAHPPLLSLSDTVDTMTHPFLFHPQAAPWFKESADTLQLTLLSELDANINTAANDKFAFIGAKAFSGQAGQLRYEVTNGETHVYGDMNGDKVADLHIKLTGVHSLDGSEFAL